MMADALWLTESSILGLTAYGVVLLFTKALLILVTAQTLADQFEFSSASLRHTIWLLAFISLAALPVLTLLLPSWSLIQIELTPLLIPNNNLQHDNYHTDTLSIFDWLVGIYCLVVVGRLLCLLIEIIRVALLTIRADKADYKVCALVKLLHQRRIRVKYSTDIKGPVTWGALAPVILLPAQFGHWPPQEQKMVLQHEVSHIRRVDWLFHLLGQCVVILYWPVPGIARAFNNLSLESERTCDNAVLKQGTPAADYAALLVHQAKTTTLPATVALGHSSQLSQRVKHIVSNYVDRAGERRTRLTLSCAALIILVPFSMIKAFGILSPSSPLAGMTIIPIFKTSSTNKTPASSEASKPINLLHRPPEVLNPPQVLINDKPLIMPSALTSPEPSSTTAFSSNLVIATPQSTLPKLLFQVPPEYPRTARRRGIEGQVVVEFDINEHGYATNPIIIESTPSTIFNDTVKQAISTYRFTPSTLHGNPLRLNGLRKTFNFKLQSTPDLTGDRPAGYDPPIDSG